MTHYTSKIAIIVLLTALSASSQQKLVETIEVRVANIDVVVRDKAGKPVVGLTKDDFELLENGVAQRITNFYEIRRDSAASPTQATQPESVSVSPAPAELRRRRVVLFVDSTSLRPATMTPVLDAVERFIDNRVGPDDQMMIVHWRLGLHVITPFTSDHAVLKRGFDTLTHLAPIPNPTRRVKRDIEDYYDDAQRGALGWEGAYGRSLGAVQSCSNEIVAQELALLESLHRTEATLAGLEGKKVILFVGETMPIRPGADLYGYTYNLFSPHLSRGTVMPGAIIPITHNMPMESIMGIPGHDMPKRIEDVAQAASADGVAVYSIGTGDVNSEFGADNSAPLDSSEAWARIGNTASSLNMMAEITGGVAITRTTNFDLAFDAIAQDLDSYYSLGYRPPNDTNTSARKIVVKTKNRAYSVRTRETLTLKSNDDQMSDRVIANLYSDGLASTWPITVRTGQPKRDGRYYIIPIQVVMPSTITLLPQENSLVGGLILYVVVGSADGQTSDVVRHPQGLKIPPAAESAIRSKPMTYTTGIRVKGGESTLSIAVLDQVSGAMGFARAKIAAR